MKITKIKTLWPENSDFKLERMDTGEEFILIHLCTAAFLSSDSGISLCPAGSCICYRPHSYQYLAAQGEQGLVHDWAHITGNFDEIALKYGFLLNTVYQLNDNGFVTEMMQAAELEVLNNKAYAEELSTMKMTELIIKMMRETENKKTEIIAPEMHSAFIEARAKIHMNYSRDWKVSEMAKLVHLSPSRFYSLYRKVFGVTPKADLQGIRLEHAKILLTENRYSVKEVAERVGYANEYYFIRAFKSITGKTPGRYGKK